MRLVAALIALAVASGCGRVWFDPHDPFDAGGDTVASGDGPACTFGPYAGWMETPNINSPTTEFAMSLTGDGLTAVFQSYRTGGGDIYRATRPTTTVDFGVPVAIAELNTGAVDGATTITPDALEIVFVSNRSGPLDLWRSRRSSVAEVFPPPTLVFSLPAPVDRDGADISADGLTLYYTYGPLGGARRIDRATRPDVASEFIDQGVIAELDTPQDDSLPTVSSDELEIVFQSRRDGINRLYAAKRATRTEPFGTPVPIAELDPLGESISDPELADDDRELYFTLVTSSRDIWSARRPCN